MTVQASSRTDLWAAALELLESRMGQATFSFLRAAVPLSLEQGELILGVSNEFQREWLSERFNEPVAACVQEVAGYPIDLSFVVTGDPPAASPASSKTPSDAAAQGPTSQVFYDRSREFPAIPLNAKYTFDSFVVGTSNRFAHAAAQRVAKSPSDPYNPLFIHSKVGLGKTHLMQAIGHYVLQNHPEKKVIYISAETFVNHVITAIRDKRTNEFRRKYRDVDVWLVDDLQFIAAIEGPQSEEEFFHTFNTLYETNRQIVIASDRPPKQLQIMNDRLRSRLEWGIIADIKPPEIETRIAILEQMAQREGLTLDRAIVERVAKHIESNIRVLEGAFTAVCAHLSLNQGPITVPVVDEILHNYSTEQRQQHVTIDRIVEVVCTHFDMTPDDLKSAKRSKDIVGPRHTAMYLCRELTDNSLASIGQYFGGRDHTTVLHACEKIADEIEAKDHVLFLINDLKARVTEP